MLFHSVHFFYFFLFVFGSYWALPFFRIARYRQPLLLAASYYAYGVFDVRFLALLALVSLAVFLVGQRIAASDAHKKHWLSLGVAVCVGVLATFKYFDFFSVAFADILSSFGHSVSPYLLNLVLPVGLSFYTFQAVGYLVDVYRERVEAERNAIHFALYMAFFPQLLAGPIERSGNLLSQIRQCPSPSMKNFSEGGWLYAWGLFQKFFVADTLAVFVDYAFAFDRVSGLSLYIMLIAWAVRLYCDFAAYSSMARGLAKMLGFELMLNFNLPFFATNPAEFWRRWHISLSSWFRDYFYGPVRTTLSRRGWKRPNAIALAAFLNMFVIGFWHGGTWGYFFWGIYWGIFLSLYSYTRSMLARSQKTALAFPLKILGWLFTFHLFCLSLSLVFTPSLGDTLELWTKIGILDGKASNVASDIFFYVGPLAVVMTLQWWKQDLNFVLHQPVIFRVGFYLCLFILAVAGGAYSPRGFIYFVF